MDPLMRIQEEIKEVVRREQEYRQLTSMISGHSDKYEDADNNNIDKIVDVHEDILSLTSSVDSKQSLDGLHSDDSGISASPSPPNGTLSINTNTKNVDNTNAVINTTNKNEKRYIGPNCYNLTPEPPQQMLMSRSISLQQLSATKARPLNINPAHKGVMQRFIASRGKLQLNANNTNNALLKLTNSPLNGNDRSLPTITLSSNSLISAINASLINDHIGIETQKAITIPTTTITSANIERDAGGKPIRPGYVPVEEKIQRELKDIKTREKELKQIRKIRQSTSDLLDSIENEILESDDNDSDVEHCYGPGKLRTAKSIGQLYDSAQYNDNTSPRLTPSPDYDRKLNFYRNGNSGMRPAMSLAQLCNLDPEDTPSSHRLIAQWESLIQQNA